MLKIDSNLTAKKLLPQAQEVFELSAKKISRLLSEEAWTVFEEWERKEDKVQY